MPPSEDIKGALWEEDVYALLEGLGFAQVAVGRLQCKIDLAPYFRGAAEGIKLVSEWLRVPPELVKKADPSNFRKLCEKGTEAVQQTRSVFLIPVPGGFEREERAQPSLRSWWPNGDFSVFSHYGLKNWTEVRRKWTAPVPEEERNKIEKVPKMSSRELNAIVDSLTSNIDRIELPGPMRLDDLLDVLVDVWDSMDDHA